MARTTGRSGFKMKSSPTKGKLGDFFSSLGNQLKAGQKERGIFSEKGKAEKKSRKAGESKFQADVRRRQETNKAKRASNKADAEYYGSAEDKAKNSEANRIKSTVTEEPKSKATTKKWVLFLLPLFAIMATAGAYEVFEWGYAVLGDPQAGIEVLGSQGDVWDAQKDILADTLGALFALFIFFRVEKKEVIKLHGKKGN